MKGLWKESVSGWNHKDSKRKKQTRNNTLRDNGCYVIRTFDGYRNTNKKVNPEVFRNETETIRTFTGGYSETKPIVTEVKIYRAFITWREVDENGEFIKNNSYSGFKECFKETSIFVNENVTSYNWNDARNAYSSITGKRLAEHYGLTDKQYWSLSISQKRYTGRTYILPKDMVQRAIERKNEVTVEDFQEDGDFIYGKPISSWKRMTFFNDGKRRKFAQNWANRMDRRNIKAWLNKHDISLEVKTHALSKSIAWEIW
jgi:hypothetical protein